MAGPAACPAQSLMTQAVWKGVVRGALLVRRRFRDHGAPI